MKDTIVTGLGNCVDYEIFWDSEAMDALIRHYGIMPSELAFPDAVRGERDILRVILCHMIRGTGGECAVQSEEQLSRFAARFHYRIALGGTGLRASITLARLGCPSITHLVSDNEETRKRLPSAIGCIAGGNAGKVYPHVIIQYNQASLLHVGKTRIAPSAANRVILTADRINEQLPLSGALSKVLEDARIFLISGFNSIKEERLLRCRMKELEKICAAMDPGATIYFEDACYHTPGYSALVLETMCRVASIHGLNDDELCAYLKRPVNLLDADDVAQALRRMNTLFPCRCRVLHTRYGALAYGENVQALAGALRCGVEASTARICWGDAIGAEETDAVRNLARDAAVQKCAQDIRLRLGTDVCVAPGYIVDVPNPTTVGLGDTFVGGFLRGFAGY